MGLSTQAIAELTLALVDWDELPGDSGIHVPGEDIESALIGIDAESPEINLADREGYDLVLGHHPAGAAAVTFPSVLDRQVELMTDHGVPREQAADAVADLRRDWGAQAHMANYRHDISVAELLDQPYMNLHLPPDELGRREFVEAIESAAPVTVADLVETFAGFPEMEAAETDVQVRVGDPDNRVGNIAIHHAAGANGGASVASAYFDNGVDTVVYIHADGATERDLQQAYGDKKNLIITGHLASDAVGMNILIDKLEAGGVDCTPISGCGLGRR